MQGTLLAIDIGNSRSHWGVFRDGHLAAAGDVPSRGPGLDFSRLLRETAAAERPLGVVACSVAPHAGEILRRQAEEAGLHCAFLDHRSVGSLRISYPRPAELGADRLANALGAFRHGEPPFLIIDMGTAVTLDAVTRANGYEGGAIAPGFALLSDYLVEKTALLPPLDLASIHRRTGIGRTTLEAMEVGCTKGFAGMIRELTATITDEIRSIDGSDPALLVTGGSFTWVRESWIGRLPYHPHLTLEGLLSRAESLLPANGGRA